MERQLASGLQPGGDANPRTVTDDLKLADDAVRTKGKFLDEGPIR